MSRLQLSILAAGFTVGGLVVVVAGARFVRRFRAGQAKRLAAVSLLVAVVLLLLLGLAIWVGFSPIAPRAAASVVFLGLTNNGAGQHGALLCFTNASSVGVVGMVHSVDYKTAEGWIKNQPVPGAVAADIASSADLGPHEGRVVLVRCPTNAAWRLRMRYHEQPRGPRGLLAQAADLLSGLWDRARPVSYTGQTSLAETSEIPQ